MFVGNLRVSSSASSTVNAGRLTISSLPLDDDCDDDGDDGTGLTLGTGAGAGVFVRAFFCFPMSASNMDDALAPMDKQ